MADTPALGPAGPGPGVDAQGKPVIDPTANVLALVEAAVRRMDDLRRADLEHLKDVLDSREAHRREVDDWREKLRRAESARIDAIRAVDVGAVSRAAEVASAQAATLAAQVTLSAETLRGQVALTQTASAVSLATALEPITKSIEDLRRAQYEQQGQRVAQTENRGGNQWAIGFALSAFVALLSVAGIVLVLVAK